MGELAYVRKYRSGLYDADTPYFPNTDKALLDRWTLGHIGVGAIMRLLGAPRLVAYALAIGFELSENFLKRSLPAFFSPYTTPDTLKHTIVDAISTISGWELANALPPERENFDPVTGKYLVVGP